MKKLTLFLALFLVAAIVYADDVEVEVTHPLQNNDCIDGFIDLQITGGYAPYDVKYERLIEHEVFGLFWITVKEVQDVNGTDGSEDLEDAMEGKYRITIVDFHCAEVVTGAEMVCECEPCEIVSEVTEPTCLGDDGGSISITMSCEEEGHAPFRAKWSDGESGLSRNSLLPGRYCVTVQDRNDCESSQCWALGAENSLSANLVQKINPSFCGDSGNFCNGSLGIEISGGESPYQINWSNGSAGESATDLCTGTYTVTITDRRGCRIVQSFELCCCEPGEGGGPSDEGMCSLEPLQMEYTVSSLPNGAINISLSGGSGSIACQWSGPSGYIDHGCSGISNINVEGEYCFFADDGCTRVNKCFKVIDCTNSNLAVSGSSSSTCPDLNAGTVGISIAGGTPPYSSSWSTGQSGEFIERLFAGEYCVTVTDDTFCSVEACFTVDDETEVTETISTADPCRNVSVCNGVEVITDEANYIDTHNDGLCVVDRFCPVNGEAEEVQLNYILKSTVGCLRTYICADGSEDQLLGIGGTGFFPTPDATCVTGYRCYENPCTYTDENGDTETYFNDDLNPSDSGECTSINYGACGENDCGGGLRRAYFYCDDILVDEQCVLCTSGFNSDITDRSTSSKNAETNSKILSSSDSKANFRVRPNPFYNEIFVDLINGKTLENASINIFDLQGKLLIAKVINLDNNENEFRLNLEFLPIGMFFLEVKSDNGTIILEKIIKL